MNMEEVKKMLCDITEMFFQGATVIWAEQINTKPPLPYVTLKTGSINRTAFPLVDNEGNRYYQCNTTLEVNLYTRGMPTKVEKNVTGNYENTATSDLMYFFNFLESEEMTDYIAGKGMDVMLMPPVRDLTDLQNDSKYRYRAMAEARVSFAAEADGPYGVGGMPAVPSYSGGGTPEMTEATIDEITTVELTEGGNENDEE